MITRQLAAEVSDTLLPGKATKLQLHTTVPQTDTGGLVEKTKANGRVFVKELGKKARRKFAICLAGSLRRVGRSESFPSDCLPKTQLSANP